MNTNEIMNNWKSYTGSDTVKNWYEIWDSGSGYATDCEICDFCDYYNYNNDVYHFLDESY